LRLTSNTRAEVVTDGEEIRRDGLGGLGTDIAGILDDLSLTEVDMFKPERSERVIASASQVKQTLTLGIETSVKEYTRGVFCSLSSFGWLLANGRSFSKFIVVMRQSPQSSFGVRHVSA
jgi:hypothetical protein